VIAPIMFMSKGSYQRMAEGKYEPTDFYDLQGECEAYDRECGSIWDDDPEGHAEARGLNIFDCRDYDEDDTLPLP